ncbi:hypothetical protein C2G38_2188536 [Gigaspora rosea]|uniref:MD-2-related lipid-recognition domain-containing protein n=1 Tax=Gigaspora rosea TaxID=44941 RepID=A0A397V4M8_9GLOM|nr:hypothetical protein C2G38_2188535 [Gigaspora rosea]RIB16983.1 hypothetical protein C2G38_2188536 [Gigaspora rosea]
MKNFIFAFILFVLLLTVNAAPFQLSKRAITFKPCDTNLHYSITVNIGTDPPESGKNKDKHNIADSYRTFNHSFKAGTPFNISASNVPTPELPDPYTIVVVVGGQFSVRLFLIACAFVTVGGSSEKSKIFDILN